MEVQLQRPLLHGLMICCVSSIAILALWGLCSALQPWCTRCMLLVYGKVDINHTKYIRRMILHILDVGQQYEGTARSAVGPNASE